MTSPNYKLHPVHGISWAALLSGFMAPAVLIPLNYWRAREEKKAIISIPAGLALAGMYCLLCAAIQSNVAIPTIILSLPGLWIVQVATRRLQGSLIREHKQAGGKMSSAWASIGIGVLCYLSVIVVPQIVLDEISTRQQAEFEALPDEPLLRYYDDGVIELLNDATEEDADLIAAIVADADFSGYYWFDFELDRDGSHGSLTIAVEDDELLNDRRIEQYRVFGRQVLSETSWEELQIHLQNDQGEVRRTMTIHQHQVLNERPPM